MALPILGKINNMYTIDRDVVVKFHKANYFGENLIVVGCGDIKHDELCKFVLESFQKLPRKPA
jgi:processing peptidase subunit alpha/processing peptidase subunit beta